MPTDGGDGELPAGPDGAEPDWRAYRRLGHEAFGDGGRASEVAAAVEVAPAPGEVRDDGAAVAATLLGRAVATAPDDADGETVARTALTRGLLLAGVLDDPVGADRAYAHAVRVAPRGSDEHVEARVGRSHLRFETGRHRAAAETAGEAVQSVGPETSPRAEALALNNLGAALSAVDDPETVDVGVLDRVHDPVRTAVEAAAEAGVMVAMTNRRTLDGADDPDGAALLTVGPRMPDALRAERDVGVDGGRGGRSDGGRGP